MLAWKPKISIGKGMETFIEWFRLENGTAYINTIKSELLQWIVLHEAKIYFAGCDICAIPSFMSMKNYWKILCRVSQKA